MKGFTKAINVLIFIAFIFTQVAALPANDNGETHGLVKQQLSDYFNNLQAQRPFSGNVLVAREGHILLKKGFGMAEIGREIPNRPGTVMAIASFTKAFTAMSIMMLKERGLLSLEDTISQYFPDFPGGDGITIHNLLRMESGLFDYLNNPALWAQCELYHEPIQLMEYYMYEPLVFPTGTQFQYSNSNYITLGNIVEQVSGLSFRDFIKLNILDPLKMKSTSYDPHETDFLNRKATGYDDITCTPPLEAMYFHPSIPYTAGAMCSTIGDLYKWDQALYGEKLVSHETLEQMFTPGLGNYGYGWYSDNLEVNGVNQKQIWHWGSYFGFHGYFCRLTDSRTTIILLLNISPLTGAPDELRPIANDIAIILDNHYR